jgi:hypothetical protein
MGGGHAAATALSKEVPVNDGHDPSRNDSSEPPQGSSTRKTMVLAIGFLAALGLLIALNMN